jgi:two-component system chemotaxis sensor kinase CheA
MAWTEEFDSDLLATFVAECKEHLSTIESDLLAIEEGGAEPELVNRVFRAAHSIKGGAGFFDLKSVKDLAHKLENVLDLMRSAKLAPNPEVTNALLGGFDRLGELVDDIARSNEYDVSSYVAGLNELVASYLSEEQKGSVRAVKTIAVPGASRPFQVEEYALRSNLSQGRSVYILRFDLIDDIHRKGRTPLEIISAIQALGVVLDCALDLGAVGTLDALELSASIPFFVLLATAIDPPECAKAIDLSPSDFTLLMMADEASSASPPTTPPADAGRAAPKPEAKVPPREAPAEAAGSAAAPRPAPTEVQERPRPEGRSPDSRRADAGDASIRIQVQLLDSLMNYAGELVLARNQLSEAIKRGEAALVEEAGQRIHVVTGNLQDAVMRTRLQPASVLFDRVPRLVRDLSRSLGKAIRIELEGKDVEFDKTIIEGLADPLTHLVRNACDHGVESPEARAAAGKHPEGRIRVSAAHEAGLVVVEVSDDGGGIDPERVAKAALEKGVVDRESLSRMGVKEKIELVTLPGFSTARELSELSGRGVGMDVVKTNVERLGGRFELESVSGVGTTVRMKLPLTLAIIPALLVSAGGRRYAIPQVAIAELIRIRPDARKDRIERMGGEEVLVLRGAVLPLLHLADVLGHPRRFFDEESGSYFLDRRTRLSDRRGDLSELGYEPPPEGEPAARGKGDRRYSAASDVKLAVLALGRVRYGLVVEELHDTVEIVVKPLGAKLKSLREYSGATILGDGSVALILDAAGIAARYKLTETRSVTGATATEPDGDDEASLALDGASYLSFMNSADEACATPIAQVERVERIRAAELERVGADRVLRRDGGAVPVYSLAQAAPVRPLPELPEYAVVFCKSGGARFGLLCLPAVDSLTSSATIDASLAKSGGVVGTLVHGERTYLAVDLERVREAIMGGERGLLAGAPKQAALPSAASSASDAFAANTAGYPSTIGAADGRPVVLLAEDSEFFRRRIAEILTEEGYRVVGAEDGEAAWDELSGMAQPPLAIVTDIEMPKLDGLGLTARLRAEPRFATLPVLALSSLASEEDVARGKAAGVSEYLVKLDRERLLESLDGLRMKRTEE